MLRKSRKQRNRGTKELSDLARVTQPCDVEKSMSSNSSPGPGVHIAAVLCYIRKHWCICLYLAIIMIKSKMDSMLLAPCPSELWHYSRYYLCYFIWEEIESYKRLRAFFKVTAILCWILKIKKILSNKVGNSLISKARLKV